MERFKANATGGVIKIEAKVRAKYECVQTIKSNWLRFYKGYTTVPIGISVTAKFELRTQYADDQSIIGFGLFKNDVDSYKWVEILNLDELIELEVRDLLLPWLVLDRIKANKFGLCDISSLKLFGKLGTRGADFVGYATISDAQMVRCIGNLISQK